MPREPPVPDFVREALRRSARDRLPVGYGIWEDDAMLWGYVLSVGKTTFRVHQISPGGKPEERETYSYSKVSFFDFDPVYGARLAALARHPVEDATKWTEDDPGIARILRHACASGVPLEIRTRSDRRRWRTRVIATRSGWAQLVELDDLCRNLQPRICRVSDIEAVSVDAGDAYLRGLLDKDEGAHEAHLRGCEALLTSTKALRVR
jgi:hypothetical protein